MEDYRELIAIGNLNTISTMQGTMREGFESISKDKKSLVRNSDFEQMPFIQSRSSVYQISTGAEHPQFNGKKSLKISSVGYETSPDPNKDFCFMLTEQMVKSDRVTISFMAYPTEPNKKLLVRLAYSSGVQITLGKPFTWNKVEVELNLSEMTTNNDRLYVDLRSSYTLFISDLKVMNNVHGGNIINSTIPISFNEVNEKLAEVPSTVRNSSGFIERMIQVGQTYLDNIEKFVYGNFNTAFDTSVDQVDGKFQIDCSSFASLIVHGVPFEKSRYAGNPENITSNIFFNNIDSYKYRYAHNIAKYAFDKGYAFIPKSDNSNLEPGDLVFFSWTNGGGSTDLSQAIRDNAFMKIDHVGIFLHKRNDSTYVLLQLDNGFKTVFYTATPQYMSQCVIAARFPNANLDRMYADDNLIVDGDTVKNSNGNIDVGTYKLTKPLVKGRYYTLIIDGQIMTEGCYFIVMDGNNQTIISDFGKVSPYTGCVELRFPYLFDTPNMTGMKIAIGGPSSITNRKGIVNWCSLYEGYVQDRKTYIKPLRASSIKTFALDPALVSDLNTGFAPYYKYTIDGNKMIINLSVPLKTLRTGNLILGQLGTDAPKNTQRIPITLTDTNNQAVPGALQVSWNGSVTIIPFDATVQWKNGVANGIIFME